MKDQGRVANGGWGVKGVRTPLRKKKHLHKNRRFAGYKMRSIKI